MVRITQLISIVLLLTAAFSCNSAHTQNTISFPLINDLQQISSNDLQNVRKSFLQIEKSAKMKICKPETKKQKKQRKKKKKPRECKTVDMGSYASSFAIMKTIYNEKKGSLVITAAHVCDSSAIIKAVKPLGKVPDEIKIEFVGTDIDGQSYKISILDMDIENDICLVFAEGFDKSIIPPAKHRLQPGEQVWNVASPVAEFHKGMVPVFQGYYSGIDENGKGAFTVPAAPGSSGSPIVNSHGEFIGVLVSLHREMSHICYSPSLPVIYNFILNSCGRCNLQYNVVDNKLESLKLEKR